MRGKLKMCRKIIENTSLHTLDLFQNKQYLTGIVLVLARTLMQIRIGLINLLAFFYKVQNYHLYFNRKFIYLLI